jgi:hypothetical protein
MRRVHGGVLAVVFVGALAFGVGVRSADACFKRVTVGVGCSGCLSTPCDECNSGTCPGTYKKCFNQHDCETGSGPQHIYWDCTYNLTKPCFELYSCVPEDPGSVCGLDNPCGKGSYISSSTSTFATYEVTGTGCTS